MQPTSHAFKENVRAALADDQLKRALANMKSGFQDKRAATIAKLPEWESLREEGQRIKKHVLANLDFYLERVEATVGAHGGPVNWARTQSEEGGQVLQTERRVGDRAGRAGLG